MKRTYFKTFIDSPEIPKIQNVVYNDVLEDMKSDVQIGEITNGTYTKNDGINIIGGGVTYPTFSITNGCQIEMQFIVNSTSPGDMIIFNFGREGDTAYRNFFYLIYFPNSDTGTNNFHIGNHLSGVSATIFSAIVVGMTNFRFDYTGGTNLKLYSNQVEIADLLTGGVYFHSGLGFTNIGSADMTITKVSLKNDRSSPNCSELYLRDQLRLPIFVSPPVGTSYDLNLVCSDENTLINVTGTLFKFSIPRALVITTIKSFVSNAASSTFSYEILLNAVVYSTINQGTNLLVTEIVSLPFSEDQLLVVNVVNTGGGTATGLKISLIGYTK